MWERFGEQRNTFHEMRNGGTTAAGHGGAADEAAAQKNRQAALLTLELLAREHAAAAPDVFERATVAVVRAACSAAPAVRSAGLLATSSFVEGLGAQLVPHMPAFLPKLLAMLESALPPPHDAPPSRDALSFAAAWLDGVGSSLLAAVPAFLPPFLPRLLRSLIARQMLREDCLPSAHGGFSSRL